MEAAILSLLEKHFTIWSERDAEKRAALINEVYHPDVEIVDPHFVAHGQGELQQLITNLQAKFPDRRFTLRKGIEGHHHVGRLFWQFGTEQQPDLETGQDIFVVENGQIRQLLVFIDVR